MTPEIETFVNMLNTTQWSLVAPQGKMYCVSVVARASPMLTPVERHALIDLVATKLGLERAMVLSLMTKTNDAILDFFSQPARYSEDWITTYLRYTSNHEAPEQFHFWVASSIISAATKRQVYFDQHYYKIFPNLYVMLIAPAGRCRRSVATHIGMNILRASGVSTVISEKITPEGLAAALHNIGQKNGHTAALTIHAPELSVFLGRQQYNEGLIALLTTLYDCPDHWEFVTRSKSEIALQNVYLTIVAASAPDCLADNIPPVAFGGGFLSRTIVTAAEETPRVFPFPMPSDPKLHTQLIERLRAVAKRSGEFTFSRDGKDWYTDWYEKFRQVPLENSLVAGYYERKQDHIIRMATILGIANEHAELIYTPELLQRALNALDAVEPSLPMAFKHIGTTQDGRNQESIVWTIRRNGGFIAHSSLLRIHIGRLNAQQISSVLEYLKGAQLIEEVNQHGAANHGYQLTAAGWGSNTPHDGGVGSNRPAVSMPITARLSP